MVERFVVEYIFLRRFGILERSDRSKLLTGTKAMQALSIQKNPMILIVMTMIVIIMIVKTMIISDEDQDDHHQ